MRVRERIRLSLLGEFVATSKLMKFKRAWRRSNPDNETVPVIPFDPALVSVGKGTYGELHVVAFNDRSSLRIGRYCSIAHDVEFILDADHRTDLMSTYPFKVKLLGKERAEAVSRGDIVVEDDVWFGQGCKILSGVTIHRGGVVAAGAVVTRDVPPYTIVGGVPAKPIRARFDEPTVERLLSFDYSKVDRAFVERNEELLYTPLDDEVLGRLLNGPKGGHEL